MPPGKVLLPPPRVLLKRHPELWPCLQLSLRDQTQERTEATFATPGGQAGGRGTGCDSHRKTRDRRELSPDGNAARESPKPPATVVSHPRQPWETTAHPMRGSPVPEETVPFHGRPLWPLAPSRRALPNSQAVCCLSSLRSPWKNSSNLKEEALAQAAIVQPGLREGPALPGAPEPAGISRPRGEGTRLGALHSTCGQRGRVGTNLPPSPGNSARRRLSPASGPTAFCRPPPACP